MALKPCKECGKEISTEAKTCPHCGKTNPTSRWLVLGRGGGCLLVFLALMAIGVVMQSVEKANTPPPTPAEIAQTKKTDSIANQLDKSVILCHMAGEKRLKAPATAEWHDSEAYQKDLGKGRTEVQIQVDAQNSFGAMMRTTVDCKTRVVLGTVVLTAIDSWQR